MKIDFFNPSLKYGNKSLFQVIGSYLILIILSLLMLLPLLLLVNVSFKTTQEFLREPTAISMINIFDTDSYKNYITAWEKLKVLKRFFTTAVMTLSASVITVVVSTLAAFPISRNHFKHSNKIFTFFLASIFFPGSLIATMFFMKFFGLYNNPVGVVFLWSLGGLAVNIFIMVGFIKGVPRELDDAAIIDGCSYFRYIFTIAMPLMKPIIATVFMLKAIGSWNDFITPYLFLVSEEFRTLSTGLYLFKGQYASNWPLLSAAIIIVALPMIILYTFMQRFIIDGMTQGALKG